MSFLPSEITKLVPLSKKENVFLPSETTKLIPLRSVGLVLGVFPKYQIDFDNQP